MLQKGLFQDIVDVSAFSYLQEIAETSAKSRSLLFVFSRFNFEEFKASVVNFTVAIGPLLRLTRKDLSQGRTSLRTKHGNEGSSATWTGCCLYMVKTIICLCPCGLVCIVSLRFSQKSN